MTAVPEPSDALIEAIAEAICEWEHSSYYYGEHHRKGGPAVWHSQAAKAVAAAMVEHLGLTEETRNEPDAMGGMLEIMGEVHMIRKPPIKQRRLVSRWEQP